MSVAAETVARLRAAFEASRDPVNAAGAAAYMRDQFPFFGIKTPDRRRLVRAALRGAQPATEADLAATVRALWAEPEREMQHTGCDLVRAHVRVCGPSFLDVLAELITTKSWWDTVDALAAHGVGPLVRREPALVAELDRWVDGDDPWLARAAILHQLTFKGATDEARLFDHCRRRAGDTEFFIRKAIGWALRQHAAIAPDAVAAFVEATPLSPLSVREARRGIERARQR